MGKYYLFFKNSISESLVYRTNVFILLISQIISLSIFIMLWTAIYKEGNTVGNYSIGSLIAYYVVSTIIAFIIQGVDVAWRISDDIRMGNVTNFILKPIDYFWSTMSIVAGKSIFNFSTVVLISVPFFFAKPALIHEFFGNARLDIFLLISLLFSFGIFMSFFYIIGATSFWLGTSQGINFMLRMIMMFLSGNMLPLDLLPSWLIGVNNFLPFKYMAWQPIQIFIGQENLEWRIFIPEIVWMVALYAVSVLIFKKGIEKYEGFGA